MIRKALHIFGILFSVQSCTVANKAVDTSASFASVESQCNIDLISYSAKFKDAVKQKQASLYTTADNITSASKGVFIADTALLKSISVLRQQALKALCEKCNAAQLLRKDSLQFVEVLHKGYCYTYTMYVLNSAKSGLAYQVTCSQAQCKTIPVALNKGLLAINNVRIENYDLLYIRTNYGNNSFKTDDISFLTYGAVTNEKF